MTRNKKDNAFAVAEKHGLKFDAVVGREEGPVKPDAFGVLYLCEQFGISRRSRLLSAIIFSICFAPGQRKRFPYC